MASNRVVACQDYQEFTKGFGIDATPLAKRLFTVFDADDSGTVDTLEFIMGMRTWAVQYSLKEKLEFAFETLGLVITHKARVTLHRKKGKRENKAKPGQNSPKNWAIFRPKSVSLRSF